MERKDQFSHGGKIESGGAKQRGSVRLAWIENWVGPPGLPGEIWDALERGSSAVKRKHLYFWEPRGG